MGKVIVLLVALYIPAFVQSQVPFERLSFEAALTKAKKQHKLVMLQLESTACEQCNSVAARAFIDELLLRKLRDECISIKVPGDDPYWETLRRKYNAMQMAGSLFFDEEGILLHRYNGTTSNARAYIELIDAAKAKKKDGRLYYALEKSYLDGNRTLPFLKQLIVERKKLDLDNDSLLNEYVSVLPADSANTISELTFILTQAPVLGGDADKMLKKNPELFNQAWYSLPLAQRTSINNAVILKSKQKAIAHKDIHAAFQVASFARSTHPNALAGEHAFQKNLIDYFQAVKDSASYLRIAIRYYDEVYMKIPVDSIRKRDSIQLKEILKTKGGDTIVTGESSYSVRKFVTFSPSVQHYANALNNAAWTVYTFTSDSVYLKKALSWAMRANEFFESSGSLDTYARILYALKQAGDAIYTQQRAIDKAKKLNQPITKLTEVLEKMKKGEKLQ